MHATLRTIIASTALILGSGGVLAQAVPVPGSVDSSKATAASRSDQEEFNRAAGRVDHKQNRKRVKRERAVPATAADVVPGLRISDSKGQFLGTVDAVDADGVVVATAAGRIRVQLEAFGKNSKGLVMSITKSEFDALVANATAKPQG
jgi:hypothetical protein